MSKRRSRLEISLIILSAIRDGVDKPTRIMYAANMSWASSQKILSSLVEQGFIEVKMPLKIGKSKKRYVITKKGKKVVVYLEKANELLPINAL